MQMMRVELYRPMHVKRLRSQKRRMLLINRQLLQSKAIAIENDLRGTLRNFGNNTSDRSPAEAGTRPVGEHHNHAFGSPAFGTKS
jgi:hypothetical protein